VPAAGAANALKTLNEEIVACGKCPRLVEYREKVAREKRRAFRDWTYWGKPVPGFGDARARLLILGLAPAAHGANRTGRMFTGDRSGDFLYAALYKAGFANQPTSQLRDDGLQLSGAYIAATCRCAPPDNKPLPTEIANCRPYFVRELEILKPRAILALGKIAWDAYLTVLKSQGVVAALSAHRFAHGAEVEFPGDLPRLFGIYHPSQQNTQTGRVTVQMYAQVLRRIRKFLGK
jgi:uracil-DNA glycosylase